MTAPRGAIAHGDLGVPPVLYDGLDAAELQRRTGASQVELRSSVSSVLDVAHKMAVSCAPHGLLVVADEQTAGRGRQGRTWHSAAGAGVWLAALLRPAVASSSGALAIRVGLAAIAAVAEAAPGAAPRLKWPNDVMVRGRKAGGVLCEARWSGLELGWIAVGVGINVRGPVAEEVRDTAIALAEAAPAATRIAVLAALAPRLWGLEALPPVLDDAERQAFHRLQWTAPGTGPEAFGVDGDGALLVPTPDGSLDRRVVPV